jgi:hypothetical protein
MLMMMGPDKKKQMTDGIVESIIGGKKEYSTDRKECDESTLLCAHEFLAAVEAKDPRKLIAAFIALGMEVEKYESEEEEEY